MSSSDYDKTPTQTVIDVGGINFSGNVIPEPWYSAITMKDGKPDLPAIIILADIVFWYRPKEIRDEITGRVIGIERKFRSDLLQRSYSALQEKFGLSRDQCERALNNLKSLGLISTVFRTIEVNGTNMSNVMFIDLHAVRLAEITVNGIAIRFKQDSYTVKTGEVSGLNGGGIRFKPERPPYSTKNTSQTTSKKTQRERDARDFSSPRTGREEDKRSKALATVRMIYDEKIIPTFREKTGGEYSDIDSQCVVSLAQFLERDVDGQSMEDRAETIVGAFDRYCGDAYWVERGLPFQAFVKQLSKYTTFNSKKKAAKRGPHTHGLQLCDDPDCTRTDENDGLGYD